MHLAIGDQSPLQWRRRRDHARQPPERTALLSEGSMESFDFLVSSCCRKPPDKKAQVSGGKTEVSSQAQFKAYDACRKLQETSAAANTKLNSRDHNVDQDNKAQWNLLRSGRCRRNRQRQLPMASLAIVLLAACGLIGSSFRPRK